MSMAHSRYCAQPNRESSIRSDPIELNSSQEPFRCESQIRLIPSRKFKMSTKICLIFLFLEISPTKLRSIPYSTRRKTSSDEKLVENRPPCVTADLYGFTWTC